MKPAALHPLLNRSTRLQSWQKLQRKNEKKSLGWSSRWCVEGSHSAAIHIDRKGAVAAAGSKWRILMMAEEQKTGKAEKGEKKNENRYTVIDESEESRVGKRGELCIPVLDKVQRCTESARVFVLAREFSNIPGDTTSPSTPPPPPTPRAAKIYMAHI